MHLPSSISRTPRQRMKSQMSPSPRKSIVKEHKIHNEEKLKVFIKFKPQLKKQRQKSQCVSFINQKQLEIQTTLNKKIYTFDHVFQPMVESESVFKVGCSQLIDEVVDGVLNDKVNNNGLVFVYGNTGTGKTHTMGLINEITPQSKGLVPDALHHIFNTNNNNIHEVCLSFCQIYKDEVYDLLDFEQEKKLNIRENQKSKQPYIEDLIMIQVKNYQQASQLINIGLEKRRIAQQKVNNRSSRGHGIITFYMRNQHSVNAGRVCFVDLAGCQRIKQSQSKGATLNEALFINTSLSALQTLLMNISDQNVRSYRSNKLTRLLQPYFEFGKIRLFVTSNYESTQSIEFAKRCKGIRFHERQVRKQSDYNRGMRTPRRNNHQGDGEGGCYGCCGNNHHGNNNNHLHNNINNNNFNTTTSNTSTNKRWQQRIQQLKKQFFQKQTQYKKCIMTLASIINKLSQTIASSISKQSIHSSFSLPELFQHLPLESKVNAKINIFQQKEESILYGNNDDRDNKDDGNNDDESFSKMSSQLSTNLSQHVININNSFNNSNTKNNNNQNSNNINEDINTVIQRTQQIMKTSQQVGFSSIKKCMQLSQLAQYKNVYKKQWFTSQIKNGLLQNKNSQFQKAILFMIEQFQKLSTQNIISQQLQAKVSKKLKQYGIVIAGEEGHSNNHSQYNNQQRQKNKSLSKTMTENTNNSNINKKTSTTSTSSNSKMKTSRKSTSSSITNTKRSTTLLQQQNQYQQQYDDQYEMINNENSQQSFNKSRKRSLIYIDED